MIGLDVGRLVAVARKEAREYRRTPFIIGAMAVLPLIFMINPVITIFAIGATVKAATVSKAVGAAFLVLLVVPATSALPMRISPRRTGVVKSGSRVPWSRS